jgi:hypothetical protein
MVEVLLKQLHLHQSRLVILLFEYTLGNGLRVVESKLVALAELAVEGSVRHIITVLYDCDFLDTASAITSLISLGFQDSLQRCLFGYPLSLG